MLVEESSLHDICMIIFHFYENNNAKTHHKQKNVWKVIILNEILVVPLSHCLAMSDLYLFYPLFLSFFPRW